MRDTIKFTVNVSREEASSPNHVDIRKDGCGKIELTEKTMRLIM